MSENTRDRLLDTAMQLFAEKGFGSTSVADILKSAEANSGSLYHFFPTKQDLLIEVLKRYHDGIGSMLLEPAWKGIGDPIAKVFALLDAYRQMLVSSDFFYGCPIGSLALELREPDPGVRELLAANFDAWTAAVEQCFAEAGDRLPKQTDRRALARFVLTIMEGAVMQARTHRNLVSYDASVSMLRDYLTHLEAEASRRNKK